MQVSWAAVLATGLFLMCCQGSSGDPMPGGPENMARPTRPKAFSSPEELRSYLDQLGNYYAMAGRPRFGKRNPAPWMANHFREDPESFRRIPLTHSELLQLLSSFNQNEDV